MGLRDLFSRAKKKVDERGGVDSLKQDASELRDIARGEGSTTDKAKEAADAVKEPGAPAGEPAPPPSGTEPPPPGGTGGQEPPPGTPPPRP
jgi:hypothetical protein